METDKPMEQLTDDEVRILTQARDARWRLESYEYAYDARVRRLYAYKVVLEFLAVLIAVVFLFVQYVAKDRSTIAHDILGLIGTGLSLAVILIVIWGHMDRWTDQIEKKRELSRRCRELIGQHSNLSEVRPVVQDKLRKWVRVCEDFEDERKHELATVPAGCLQAGHQHVGNTHVKDGVLCLKCNRQWTQEMNRITWMERLFSAKCDACGVPHEKANGRTGGTASQVGAAG
jgi:mobilome CxxCx(11)CxxC protein